MTFSSVAPGPGRAGQKRGTPPQLLSGEDFAPAASCTLRAEHGEWLSMSSVDVGGVDIHALVDDAE